MAIDSDSDANEPAALAAAVLTEEAKRQETQAARSAVTVLPDDLLPGVGAEPMPMRETLRAGGAAMVIVLGLITIAEELERAAGGVLAPDIQDTLHMSDTTLIGISAFGGVALVLGAVPLAWLADRVSRVRIVWIATLGWGVATAINGLVVNPFQLFCTRLGIGLRSGLLGPGVRIAAHRHVSDPGPGPRVRDVLDVATDRAADRPVRRGRDRRRRGRARGLALDVPHAGLAAAAARDRLRSRCSASPSAAATSRSSCSARCSRRRRSARSSGCRCRPRTSG